MAQDSLGDEFAYEPESVTATCSDAIAHVGDMTIGTLSTGLRDLCHDNTCAVGSESA